MGAVQRRSPMFIAAVTAGLCLSLLTATGSAMAGKITGTGGLNAGGLAQVTSLSCGSPGNCGAGGYYTDGSGHRQAFVVSEVKGTWDAAIQVPGTGQLNAGGSAEVASVSCPSAGSCAAGGFYHDASGQQQAFVVSEVKGRWRRAIEVPGTATLNAGGGAQVSSVSCASAGNCAAGGHYTQAPSHPLARGPQQAFVVSQVNGTWGMAIQVPGTAALNVGGSANVESVSCGSAGNCGAAGFYQASSGLEPFVVSEADGAWRAAKVVPGLAALNTGGYAELWSVSCGSARDCTAGGFYRHGAFQQGLVVSEVRGKWGAAKRVPGLAKLNAGGFTQVQPVSCASAAYCGAGGFYSDSAHAQHAFVASQVNGAWGAAKEAPGTEALNTGGLAVVISLSCASPGNCGASGYYTIYAGEALQQRAFVLSEVHGRWVPARELRGVTLTTAGPAEATSLSCASAGNCGAGGYYTDSSGHEQAFVASQVNGHWHQAIEVPGL